MKLTPATLHGLATLAFVGLFALLMVWNTWLASPARFPTALTLLVSITPLLLPMRGFLKGRTKSCGWMAYVSLIYLIHGTVEAYAEESTRLLALAEAGLSLSLFFATVYYIRQAKAAHAGTTADPV